MIIRIDKMAESQIYLQIRDQIVAAIAQGVLRPGDGLPSVRALAADLGVNLHTVNKAYAVLRDEGYVIMRGRSGTFIAEPLRNAASDQASQAQAQLADRLLRLVQAHKAAGGSAEGFLEEAHRQTQAVYGDPGVVGARREVGVLGLTPEGERLTDRGDGAGSREAHFASRLSGVSDTPCDAGTGEFDAVAGVCDSCTTGFLAHAQKGGLR